MEKSIEKDKKKKKKKKKKKSAIDITMKIIGIFMLLLMVASPVILIISYIK